MMRLLSLDLGKRHTGLAVYDSATEIVLPLDTVTHASVAELVSHVASLVSLRGIDRMIVGQPLLLRGREGAQAAFVAEVCIDLASVIPKIPITLLDERFTSPRKSLGDPHAEAACEILRLYLKRAIDG